MSEPTDEDIAVFVASTATILDLPIAAKHRAAVLVNMRTLLTHAAVVTAFALDFEDAAAVEFRA